MACYCGGCPTCLHDQGLDCGRRDCERCLEAARELSERERTVEAACPVCGEPSGGARHEDCREEAPATG